MAQELPQHYGAALHSFRLSGDPDPYAITYGVHFVDAPVAADIDTLAAELKTVFADNVMPVLSNLLTLQNTELRYQGTALPDPPGIGSSPSSIAGGNTGASNLAPPNVSFLVHKRTSFSGPHGRGRLYLPGVPEGSVDNVGTVLAGTITAIQDALDGWLADLIALDDVLSMVVLHDSVSISPVPPPYAVSSLTIDPLVATQRRRLRK